MDLSRISRKWAEVTVTATLADGSEATLTGVDFAVLPFRATPDDATVWTAATTFTGGVARVLLAGPDASATGALVVPAGVWDLWARVIDAQEVDVVMVERIPVQ